MMIKKSVKVRSFSALSIAAVAAIALTGCSSGGGGTADGSKFASNETISFRLVTAEGSGLSNYPDAQVGARAAVTAINAAGGVNGKKIDFTFCNTRADANQSLTCSRAAVSDKVDALVGGVDVYNSQSLPILSQGGIPSIGAIVNNGIDVQTDISYPLHGGNYGNIISGPNLCKEAGFKTFANVSLDFASSLGLADISDKNAKALGLTVGDKVVVPGTGVIDYSPYAQKLKDANIECAFVQLGPAALSGFYKAAAGIGLKTQLAATVFSFGESEAQAAGAQATNGIWAVSPVPSPNDTANPAIAEWTKGLDAAGVSATDLVLRRSAGINAFLSVYAAAAIAGQISGEVTPASMVATLKSTKPVDVKGVFTWDPAALGTAALGAFPRLPDAPVSALKFQDGKLVTAGFDPIKTPLSLVR